MHYAPVFFWLTLVTTIGASRPGYIASIPPESAEARNARHHRIAERRSGPVVIVHRGASAIAPENTLEAFVVHLNAKRPVPQGSNVLGDIRKELGDFIKTGVLPRAAAIRPRADEIARGAAQDAAAIRAHTKRLKRLF